MGENTLDEEIAANGTSKALVLLRDSNGTAASLTANIEISESGRITRRPPAFSLAAAAEVSSYLVNGGQMHHDAEILFDTMLPPPLHLLYLGVVYGSLDSGALQSLQNHPSVEAIYAAPELNLISPVAKEPSVNPAAGLTWGLTRLGAPDLWERGFTGQGVTVAHLDTGANSQHPILQGAIAASAFFDPSGQAAAVTDPYSDTADHGTHTAGTLGGRVVPSGPVVGMAPGATIASATVIEGGDVTGRVLAGMDWALRSDARVLSMSIGIVGWVEGFEAIMQRIRAQQLLPVIAIGNEGQHSSRSPGNYPSALSVGAIDQTDHVPQFSSSARPGGEAMGPVLCAPGVDVLSAVPGGGFQQMRGTSQATPHVAGLAALLLSAKPKATVDEIHDAIVGSCQNPQNVDQERIGAGIPDALRALTLVVSN